jgi:hypothetical protein
MDLERIAERIVANELSRPAQHNSARIQFQDHGHSLSVELRQVNPARSAALQ